MDRETFEKLTNAAQNRVINQQKRESAYTKPASSEQSKDTVEAQRESLKNGEKAPPKNRSKELLGLLNLKNISLDSERALIVGILLLLAHEEADEWLILALIYVML